MTVDKYPVRSTNGESSLGRGKGKVMAQRGRESALQPPVLCGTEGECASLGGGGDGSLEERKDGMQS